jgi:hypothetical protein
MQPETKSKELSPQKHISKNKSFRSEGEIRTFSDEGKLREYFQQQTYPKRIESLGQAQWLKPIILSAPLLEILKMQVPCQTRQRDPRDNIPCNGWTWWASQQSRQAQI